jgi:AcrR family transcriptional regulator
MMEERMAEARSGETRVCILDAAEHLFMAHGYDGTSMRQITSEAGVNLAAVNYHFGSKEALIREVLRRRLDWLNDERLRVLARLEAEAGEGPVKPSLLVDGFFGTLLRMADDDEHGGLTFLRLLGRTMAEPSGFIRTFLAHEYRVVVDRYREAFFRAMPGVPKAEIIWRFHFMLGATSYAIAGTDSLRLVTDWQIEDEDSTDRLDRLVQRLMSFMLGGLRAPLPQFPGRAPDNGEGTP